jgi:cbb3-type cytochrome oxidase maturation protein
MTIAAILILGGLIFLSGSALIAFTWAAKTGQFKDLKKGANVIFDEDEPIGKPTDRFPDKTKP